MRALCGTPTSPTFCLQRAQERTPTVPSRLASSRSRHRAVPLLQEPQHVCPHANRNGSHADASPGVNGLRHSSQEGGSNSGAAISAGGTGNLLWLLTTARFSPSSGFTREFRVDKTGTEVDLAHTGPSLIASKLQVNGK